MPYSWYFTWISWKRDRSINFYGHSKSISWIGKDFTVTKLELIHWRHYGEQVQLISSSYHHKIFYPSEVKDLSQLKIFPKQPFCFEAYLHLVHGHLIHLRGSKVHLSFSIDNLMEVHLTHNSKVYWLMIYNGNNNSHLSLSGHGIIFHKNRGRSV